MCECVFVQGWGGRLAQATLVVKQAGTLYFSMGGTCRKEERARIDAAKAFGTGARLEKISATMHKILQKNSTHR